MELMVEPIGTRAVCHSVLRQVRGRHASNSVQQCLTPGCRSSQYHCGYGNGIIRTCSATAWAVCAGVHNDGTLPGCGTRDPQESHFVRYHVLLKLSLQESAIQDMIGPPTSFSIYRVSCAAFKSICDRMSSLWTTW